VASDGSPTSGRWRPHDSVVAILVIAVGALLLRFHNIDEWGMWIDELYSVQRAAELAHGDVNSRTPAYVQTLIALELSGVDMSSVEPRAWWTWRAAGIVEWNMRAHVAVLGAATILILGLVGRRDFGDRATLLLCLLLALSPWHLWMSQVLRFYMQLFLLYSLALLLYYQATESGQLWRAALAMVCVVLAFYTTPIALMIAGVFGVDVVVSWLRRRPTGMRPSFWVIGVAGLAACVLSILNRFEGNPGYYSGFTGSPQPLFVMALGIVYLVGVPLVIMAALGFWALLRSGRERLAVLLLASVLLPPVALAAFSAAGKDIHLRYAFVGLFAWLALAAVGIELIVTTVLTRWGRLVAWLPAAALVSSYVVPDYVYMTSGAGYRGQWRQAFAYVKEHRRPGELVGGDHVARQMARYYLEEPDVLLLPRSFSSSDVRELVPGPAWIVIRAYEPSVGDRSRDVEAAGQLRAYFANRISQPNHTINVYYYPGPGGAPVEPSAGNDHQAWTVTPG
jgi:Dolichyl-phosphate-mannose-protein mannosyltransferase